MHGLKACRRGVSGVQARVEGKGFLLNILDMAFGLTGCEDQVPAVPGDGGRHQAEAVALQQLIPKGLLAGAMITRNQPVGIWNIRRVQDMNSGQVRNACGCQYMRGCVENLEPLVDGDFQDGRRRICGAVNSADAWRIPAAAGQIRAFAGVPAASVPFLIDPP